MSTTETKTLTDEATDALNAVENEIDTELGRYRADHDYEEAGIALLLVGKAILAAGRAQAFRMEELQGEIQTLHQELNPAI